MMLSQHYSLPVFFSHLALFGSLALAGINIDVPLAGADIELCAGKSLRPRAVGLKNHFLSQPSDLKFRPGHPVELWVSNRGTSDFTRFRGVSDDLSKVTFSKVEDSLKQHYSEKVSSFDFSRDGAWISTCQDSNNNYHVPWWGGNGFMGPSLFKTDDIGIVNGDLLWGREGSKALYGSHYDMNHEAPYCMGIALDKDRAFWAFNGKSGVIMRFDFDEDHGAGGSDHSKAHVRRYKELKVTRIEGVPSHLMFDKERQILYVADTGGNRVLRVDMSRGVEKGDVPSGEWPERLLTFKEWEIQSGGSRVLIKDIQQPSGLFLTENGNTLLVGSAKTGKIIIVDANSGEMKSGVNYIQTGAGQLAGLAIHPITGHIFYTDMKKHSVGRLECVGNGESLEIAPPLAGIPRMRRIGGVEECTSVAPKVLQRSDLRDKTVVAIFEAYADNYSARERVKLLNEKYKNRPENVEFVYVNDYRSDRNLKALSNVAEFPIIQAGFGALVTLSVFDDAKSSSQLPNPAIVVYDRYGYVVYMKKGTYSGELDNLLTQNFYEHADNKCGCPSSEDITVRWQELEGVTVDWDAQTKEGSVLRFDIPVLVYVGDSLAPVHAFSDPMTDFVIPHGEQKVTFKPLNGNVQGPMELRVMISPCIEVPSPPVASPTPEPESPPEPITPPVPEPTEEPVPAPTPAFTDCGEKKRYQFKRPSKFGGQTEKNGSVGNSCDCKLLCSLRDATHFSYRLSGKICYCLLREPGSRLKKRNHSGWKSGEAAIQQ